MAKVAIKLYIESELDHGEEVPLEASGTLIATISVEIPSSRKYPSPQ